MVVIILGVSYREATILSIDKKDYDDLKNIYNVNLKKHCHEKSSIIRGFIVRMFFFIILNAWWYYKGYPILEFSQCYLHRWTFIPLLYSLCLHQ
ncbi:MAG: hypothetical protein QW279_14895 [Candidatus Jordarchaeaceae archaeon]